MNLSLNKTLSVNARIHWCYHPDHKPVAYSLYIRDGDFELTLTMDEAQYQEQFEEQVKVNDKVCDMKWGG